MGLEFLQRSELQQRPRACVPLFSILSPFVDGHASSCFQATVQGMRNVTDLLDGTRPVTMNHLITNPAEAYLDM